MSEQMIYVAVGSEGEAKTIARTLVEENLAACVNIINSVNSFYKWNNQLNEDIEYVLICKTSKERQDEIIRRIKSLHSYECPGIVSIPIEGGYKPYLEWIKTSVANQTSANELR